VEVGKFEIVCNLEEFHILTTLFDDLFCEGGLVNQSCNRSIHRTHRRIGQGLSGVLLSRHARKLIQQVNMVEDVEEHLEELYQEECLVDEWGDSLVV
jgi:hypothetical protein